MNLGRAGSKHFGREREREVDLFRSVGAAVHLQQTYNIRIDQSDEVNDLLQVAIGAFQVAAEWNRQVKTSANPGAVTDVV